MKSLTNYLTETKEIKKETYTDEDTGEVLTFYREIDPEEERKRIELLKKEEDEYRVKREKEEKILAELADIVDSVSIIINDLREVDEKYRSLLSDQEDEVGKLYLDNKYKEGDKAAQKYGEKFNELANEKERLEKEYKNLQIRRDKLNKELNNIW